MAANCVLPSGRPDSSRGTLMACSTFASAITRLYDMSVCQPWPAAQRSSGRFVDDGIAAIGEKIAHDEHIARRQKNRDISVGMCRGLRQQALATAVTS